MQPHVAAGRAPVETLWTLVGLLAAVGAEVHHQLGAGLERLAALCTLVLALVRVAVEHVAVEAGPALEPLPTHLADERGFLKVNTSAMKR